MLIAKILEEMMGETSEFERCTILMPLDQHSEARDLAYQMGVPLNRLLAELVLQSLPTARSEWRALGLNHDDKPAPATAPALSLQVPPRIK